MIHTYNLDQSFYFTADSYVGDWNVTIFFYDLGDWIDVKDDRYGDPDSYTYETPPLDAFGFRWETCDESDPCDPSEFPTPQDVASVIEEEMSDPCSPIRRAVENWIFS